MNDFFGTTDKINASKPILTALLFLTCIQCAAQRVVFTPAYTPQAQFVGYYVAKEKNFYSDEGLDVVIRHIGSGKKELAADLLLEGQIDIAGQHMPQAILSRSKGDPIVNVFQLTQHLGLCCVTKKPIKSAKELNGLKIAKWANGYTEICEALEKAEDIHINWVLSFDPVNLFIFDAVDGVIVYSFNELIKLEQSVGGIDRENIFAFADIPLLDIPEEGLFVTESFYNGHRDLVEKFVRASKLGWDYAREHTEEALEISWRYIQDNNIVSNHQRERAMLEEHLKLQINSATGKPDYARISEEKLKRLTEVMLKYGFIQNDIEYKDFIK